MSEPGAIRYPDFPLFPLSSIVFPGGVMPLRIFEPRYIDMVRICFRGNTGFGVCPAESGSESGADAAPGAVGTLVEIVDFDRTEDGMLTITVEGRRRFEVMETRRADNRLWWGTVRYLQDQQDVPCPDEFQPLQEVLAAVYVGLGEPYASRPRHFDRAGWLSARLAELLPFDPATKQVLLETADPVERLRQIQPLVRIERS